MSKKEIILKQEYFRYPTENELSLIEEKFSELTHFDFEYVNSFFLAFKPDSLESLQVKDNLYWWDNTLCNKLGKLRTSFYNVAVNYCRSIEKSGFEIISEKSINKIQFDYYVETLYYYLFSSRDIIFQILNVYYNLGIKEDDYGFNKKVKNSIKNESVKELILGLSYDFKVASEIRNSFTHRFPANQIDYRVTYSETPEGNCIKAGNEKILHDKDIFENITFSIKRLEGFILSLKSLLLTKKQ